MRNVYEAGRPADQEKTQYEAPKVKELGKLEELTWQASFDVVTGWEE